MQEPVWVMKDGTNVPYVPVTITTNRDAYAASLHVLFKHVADFHLCVVRVFSVKYGIPEDDILKTIQESDEFKHMQVDPIIRMDMGTNLLGHLDKAPVPVPVPVKPIASHVKKTKKSEPEPVAVIATEESRPTSVAEHAVKTKIIRKKIPQAIDPTPTPTPTPTPEPPNPVAVVIVIAEESRPDTDPPSEPIKTKTIRKKIVPKPNQPITEPIKVAPATIAPTAPLTEDAPRKIIKKNIKSTA